MAEISDVDLSLVGSRRYGQLEVEIVDKTGDYVKLKEIFDFPLIRKFLRNHPDFDVLRFHAWHHRAVWNPNLSDGARFASEQYHELYAPPSLRYLR
jgi:hypothetical protein